MVPVPARSACDLTSALRSGPLGEPHLVMTSVSLNGQYVCDPLEKSVQTSVLATLHLWQRGLRAVFRLIPLIVRCP